MIQSIVIELPVLPKMANGSHGSWRADYARKMRLRKMIGLALYGKIPAEPWERAIAVFTRFSATQPDDDGLVHGFKAIRDALKHFEVIVDDHPRCLTAVYRWEKAPKGKGKIRIEVRMGIAIADTIPVQLQ